MTLLRPWEAGLVLRAPGQPSDHVHTGARAGAQGSHWRGREPCGGKEDSESGGAPLPP